MSKMNRPLLYCVLDSRRTEKRPVEASGNDDGPTDVSTLTTAEVLVADVRFWRRPVLVPTGNNTDNSNRNGGKGLIIPAVQPDRSAHSGQIPALDEEYKVRIPLNRSELGTASARILTRIKTGKVVELVKEGLSRVCGVKWSAQLAR